MRRFDLPTPGGGRICLLLEGPEAGSGGAVLYLHGFGSRQAGEKGAFFRMRAQRAGINFASIDFRGHGESGGSMRELTVSRNLEDIAVALEFLSARGFGPIALFGSSMGGAAALWHAALAPASVAAVVAIAPALDTLESIETELGPERMASWQRDGVTRLESEGAEAEVAWGLIEDLRRYPRAELASRLDTPALLFHGRRDATVDWRISAELAESARPGRVRLRLFDAGDHRLLDRLDLLWSEAATELKLAFAGGSTSPP